MILKKSILTPFILAVTLVLSIISNANAARNDALEITDISRSASAIEITWSGDYTKYEVFADGKSVYEGSDNSFNHEGLNADTAFEYLIVAFDENNEIVDEAKVETYTTQEKKNKALTAADNSLASIRVSTIYKKDSFRFDWDDIRGIDKYDVYKDHEKIGTIKGSEYSETQLEEGLYEFIGKIEVDDFKKEEIRREAEEKLQRELTPAEEEEVFFENYSIIKSFTPNIGNKNILNDTKEPAFSYVFKCYKSGN